MSDKIYQKLPAVLRTTAIKNFFESTVEQLFSKANTETAYGFLGNKTAEDLGAKGVYVPEPTSDKRFYSLSPVVNNINSSTGKSQDLIFFDEFLDTLNIYGVDVRDQNKLFGEKYYSYLPPIDQDKLLNYQEYYWVPGGPRRITITGTVANPIDIETDVIGQSEFTTLNGKVFRDGMVVYFTGDNVQPEAYKNREFIVEGVGEKIFLVPNDQEISCKYVTTTALPWDGSGEIVEGSNVRHSSGQITSVDVVRSDTGYVDPTFRFIGTLAVDPALGISPSTCTAEVDSDGRVTAINVDSTPDQLYSDQVYLALELYLNTQQIISSGSSLPGSITTPYVELNEFTEIGTEVRGRIDSRITEVNEANNRITVTGFRFFFDNAAMTTPDSIDVAGTAIIPLLNVQNARVGQRVRINFLSYVANMDTFNKTVTLDQISPVTSDPEQDVILATSLSLIFRVFRSPDINVIGPTSFSVRNTQARMDVNPITGDYYIVGGEYAFDADFDGDGRGDIPWSEDISQRVPDYIVQARGAKNNNVWSRVNFWFHRQNFIDAGQPVPDATFRAVRPIVEFDHRLELTDHGVRSLGSVSIAVTDASLSDISNLDGLGIADSYPLLGSTFILPNEPVSISRYIYYTIYDEATNKLVPLRMPNPLTNATIDGRPAVDGEPGFSALVLQPGDTLYVIGGAVNSGSEYYFTSEGFVLAQEKPSVNYAPLFELYDDQGINLRDLGTYPASTFRGNKIFGYAQEVGTATNATLSTQSDSVLGFPLVYRQFKASAEILFENFIDTTPYEYFSYGADSSTEIIGTKFYKLLDDDGDVYHALWKESDTPNSQWVITSYTVSQIDVNDNKMVYDIGAVPRAPALTNIKVTVNGTSVTNFTYSTYPEITFVDQTFAAGDYIEIRVRSEVGLKQLQSDSHFELPLSWDHNILNENLSYVSEPEFLQHFRNYMVAQSTFTGDSLASNNYNSTSKNAALARDIVKTDQDLILGAFLLDDQPHNLVDALRFNAAEYQKYKNRLRSEINNFVNMYGAFDIPSLTNDYILEQVLRRVTSFRIGKTVYNRTYIVPYGDNYQSYEIVVNDIFRTTYVTDISSDLDNIENALLVFHGSGTTLTQLIADYDYVVTDYTPITIEFTGTISPALADTITVRVYDGERDSAQCPPTPSTMGLYPLTMPVIEQDDTFDTPVMVVVGHDGSRTPTVGNRADEILLEFERRVYNATAKSLRDANSVAEYNKYVVKPGRFRTTGFSSGEWSDLTRFYFNNWVTDNGVDPVNNEFFDSGDSWTWNYRGTNTEPSAVPGHWRGWYEYYYDTVRPNTHPWEMLGFTEEPSWWTDQYGTDYSSTNTFMWDDLQAGIIRQGSRANILNDAYLNNNLFRRPGLSGFLPVDATGELRAPQDIVALTESQTHINQISAGWRFGDLSPVENAWTYTETYAFAVVEALLLAKPGLFATQFADPQVLYRAPVNPLYVFSKYTKRRWKFNSTTDFKIHGTTDSAGEFVTNLGYTQFIHSWLQFQGLDTDTDFGDKVRTLNVKIGNRMSGFIDKDTMTLRTDQYSSSGSARSLIIPNENIDVQIHASPYKSRNYYSGVIIEKTALGYKVRGYDRTHCYFDIIPSLKTGARERITVGGKPADFTIWEPNTTYKRGAIVQHINSFYKAPMLISSGATFDKNLWDRLPALPQKGGATATLYQQSTGQIERIEYEHEFTTVEDVYDFLVSLGRYQRAQGYDFSEFDSEISDIRNWAYAGKQFLFWTTGNWEIGNTLELSPLASKVTFHASQGFIAKINRVDRDQFTIVDQSGATISPQNCEIVRLDDYISISPPPGQQIYGVLLFVKEIEHALVIDNVTNFNDVIFDPVINQRHRRLKIKARRTAGWTGKLLSEGYLINNEELKPNLDNLAESLGRYHELGFIPVEKQIYQAARALFGYQEREYLRELDILDDEQYEFYRGMIQAKGTAEAMKMIAESSAILNGKLDIYDEWALRVGDFGDVENSQAIELKIAKNEIVNDPQLVTLAFPEDITGVVERIDVFSRKFRYTSPPLIVISEPTESNGVQATAVATLNEYGELGNIAVTNSGSGYDYTSYAQIITGSVVTGLINTRFQLAAAYSTNSWISVSSVAGQNLSLTDNLTGNTALVNFTGITTAQEIADRINYEPLLGGNAAASVKGTITANVFVSNVDDGAAVNTYYTLQIVGSDFNINSAPAGLYLETGRYQPRQRYAIETANSNIVGNDIIVKVGESLDTLQVVDYLDNEWEFDAGDVWESRLISEITAGTGVVLDVNLGTGINNGSNAIAMENLTIVDGEYPYLDVYINDVLVRNKTYTTEMSVPFSDLALSSSNITNVNYLYITSDRAPAIRELLDQGVDPGFIRIYANSRPVLARLDLAISNVSTNSDIVVSVANSILANVDNLVSTKIIHYNTQPTVYRVMDSDTVRINIEREALPLGVLESYVPDTGTPGEQTEIAWRLAAGSKIKVVEYATVDFVDSYEDDLPGNYLQIISTAPDGISIKVGTRRIYEITPDLQDDDLILIDIDDASRFLKRPTGSREHNLWPSFDKLDHTGITDQRYPTMPNAGYVNRDHVNFRVFDIANLPELYAKDLMVKPRGGHTIHVANAENGSWNVYQLEPINGSVSYLLNNQQEVELYTDRSLYNYTDGNRIGDSNTQRYLDNYICLQNAKVSDNVVTWSAEEIIQQEHAEVKKIHAPRMIESRIKSIKPSTVLEIDNVTSVASTVYQGLSCSSSAPIHNTVTITGFTNKNIRDGDVIKLNSISAGGPSPNGFTGSTLYTVSNVTSQSLTITSASTTAISGVVMTHMTKTRIDTQGPHNLRVGDVVRLMSNSFSGVYTVESTPSRTGFVIDAVYNNTEDKSGVVILPGLEIETTSVHGIQPDYAANGKRVAVHFAEPAYLNRVHEVTEVTPTVIKLGKCLPETTEQFVYYEQTYAFLSTETDSVLLDFKPLLSNYVIYQAQNSQVVNTENYKIVSDLSGDVIVFDSSILTDTPVLYIVIRELQPTGEKYPVITTVDHGRVRINGADVLVNQYNNIHGVTTSFNRALDLRRILAKENGLSVKFLDSYNISVFNPDTSTNMPLLSIDNYGPYLRDTTILPSLTGAPGLIVGALPINYRNADVLDQEFNKGTQYTGATRGLNDYNIDQGRNFTWDPNTNAYLVDPPVLSSADIANVVLFDSFTGKIELNPDYSHMFSDNRSELVDFKDPGSHVAGELVLTSLTGNNGVIYDLTQTVIYSGVQYKQYYLGVSDSLTYDIYETVQINTAAVYTVLVDRVYPPLEPHDYYATVSAYSSFKSLDGLTILPRTDIYYNSGTTIDLNAPVDPIAIDTGMIQSLPPVEPAFYAGKQLIPEPFAQVGGISGSSYTGGNNTDAKKNFENLPQLAIGSYRPGSKTHIRVLSSGHNEFMLWTPGLVPGAWAPVKDAPASIKPLGYGSGYYAAGDSHQPISVSLNSQGAYPGVGLDSQGWGAVLPRFMYSRDFNVYPLMDNQNPVYAPDNLDSRDPQNTGFIRPEEIFVACFWTELYTYKNQLVGFDYKNTNAGGNPAPIYQDYQGTIVRVKYIRLTELPDNACLRRPIPDTGWGGIGWRNVITDSVAGKFEVTNEEEIWQLFSPSQLSAGGTDETIPSLPASSAATLKKICPTPASDRISLGEVSERVPLVGTTTDPYMILNGTVLSSLPLPGYKVIPHLEYDLDLFSVRGERTYASRFNWRFAGTGVADADPDVRFDYHTFKIAGNDYFKVVFDFSNSRIPAAGIVVVQNTVPFGYGFNPYTSRDDPASASRTAELAYWETAKFVEGLTTQSDGALISNDGSQIRDYGNQLMRNGQMYAETGTNKTALNAFGITSAQAEQTTAPYALNLANSALATTTCISSVNSAYPVKNIGVQGVGFIEGTIDQSQGQYVTVFVAYGDGSETARYGLFVSYLATELPILASQVRDNSTLTDASPSSTYAEGADVQLYTFKSTANKAAGYFCNTVTILGTEVESPNVYFPYHTARGAEAALVPGTKTASPDFYKAGAQPARTLTRSSSLEEFSEPGSLPEFHTVEFKGYYKAERTGTHYFRFKTNNAEAYAWINSESHDDLSSNELYKQDGYKSGTNYTVTNATLKTGMSSASVMMEAGKYYFIRGIFGTRYSDTLLKFEHSDNNSTWSMVTFSGRPLSVTDGVETPLMVGSRAQIAPGVILSPVVRATQVQPSDQLPPNRVVNSSVQRITGGYIVPLATRVTNTNKNSKPLINLDPLVTTNNILRNDMLGTPRAIDTKVNLSGQTLYNTSKKTAAVVLKNHDIQTNDTARAITALTEVLYSNTPTINITPLARVARDQYRAARPTIKVPLYRPTPGTVVTKDSMAKVKPNSEIIINGRTVLLRNNSIAEAVQRINSADAGVQAFQDVTGDSMYIQSLTAAPITFKNGRAGGNHYQVLSVNPSSTDLGQGYSIGDRLRLVGGEPLKVSSGAIVNISITESGAGYSSVNDLSIVVESDVGYGAIMRVARLTELGGIADIEILREGVGYDPQRPPRIRVISATGNPLTQAQLTVELGDAMPDNQLARVAKFIVTGVDANGKVTNLKTIDPGLYKRLPASGEPVALEYDIVVPGTLLGSVDPSRGFIPYGQGHPEYAAAPFVNGKHPDWSGVTEYKINPINGSITEYSGTPGALDPYTYVYLGSPAELKPKTLKINLAASPDAYVTPNAVPGGTGLLVTLASESVFSGDEASQIMELLSLANEVTELNIARSLSSWINHALSQYGVDVDELSTRVVKTGLAVTSLEIETNYPALQLDSDTPEFLEMLGIPSGTYTANMLRMSSSLSSADVKKSASDQNKIASLIGGTQFDTEDMGASDVISLLDARTITTDSNSLFGQSDFAFHSELYRYTLRNMNKQPLRVVQVQGKQTVNVFAFKSLRYDDESQVTGRLADHKQLWVDNYADSGWAYLENGQVVARQTALVDTRYVRNSIIYDRDSGKREIDLYLWDPFKGVLPGFIQREIDFITEVDPVTYNTARTDFGRKNIGKVWWDTSTVKYEWYEQGTNRERWLRWGAMFPGSTITVCEWVESKALPQNWTGDGRPRWNDRYITERHIDPETGKHIQYYYYWVQNRSTLTERTKDIAGRQLDTQAIARYIGNPVGLGVSMVSFVSTDSFVLSNIANVLREDDNIIQINFSRNLNPDGIKHTAWKLMRENDNNSVIPDYLTLKLIDSLAGENAVGQNVPDPTLSEVDRYGIQFRPRQTMFKNVKEARRTFAAALNNILVDMKLATNYRDWDLDLPSELTYFSRVNWYEIERIAEATNSAVRYNSSYKPVFSVGSKAELQAFTNVADGTVIQVKQTATSRPQLYIYQANIQDFKLISIASETIQVNSNIYTDDTNTLMALEIRAVLTALIERVFVDTVYWNKIFFELLKYAYMEQEQLSWAFKTTYLYVEKEEQDLVQINGFKPDNFDKILSYLNEVKPFSAKIRDYKDGKSAPVEVIGGQSIDDYDKPIYIDYETGEQRMLDDANLDDRDLMLSLDQYRKHASSQVKNAAPFRRVTTTMYFDRTNWQLTESDWDSSITPVLLSVARNMSKLNGMTTEQISADTTIRAIDRIFKGNVAVRTEFENAVTNFFMNTSRWDPRVLTGIYLTKPAFPTDVELEVNNINLLPVYDPEKLNTLYIGDEKIRYRRVEGNTLKQVTRGIHGTTPRAWNAGETVWAGDVFPWETTSWDRSVLLERYASGTMTPGTDPLIITDTYKLYALLVEGVLDTTLALLKTAVGGDFRGEYLDGRYFYDGVPGYSTDTDVFAYHGYASMGWDTHVLDTYQIVQNFEGTFNEAAVNFVRENRIYEGFDSVTFKRLYGEERPEEMVKLDPLESMIMRVTTAPTANVNQGFQVVLNPAGTITSLTYDSATYGDLVTRSYGVETVQFQILGDGSGAIIAANVTNNMLTGMPYLVSGGADYTYANVSMLASLLPSAQTVTYQIHHNMFGGTQYLRLVDRTMTLEANISQFDRELTVNYNFSGYDLPEPTPENPGVIWLGTECIQYYAKAGNVLKDLRRGTAGTTQDSHVAGENIWLGTTSEILRGALDPERVNWLDGDTTSTSYSWGSFVWGAIPWGSLGGSVTLNSAMSLADFSRANITNEASIMRFLHYPEL